MRWCIMADGSVLTTPLCVLGIPPAMTDKSVTASTSAASDGELLRRIRLGEVDRFGDLIIRYHGHVVRIVSRRIPADRVEEIVHDVFVRAYLGLSQFSGTVEFGHWLAGIAVRACYDFWRDRKRAQVPVSALTTPQHQWIEQVLAARSDQEFREQARQQEAAEVLEWALGQLSPENRTVLTLVHLDGHSVREAAELLGWSLINVKVRAHRARQALRNILNHSSRGKPR